MSVGRPNGQPLSPGGRPLQPVHVGAQRSTGPVDRAAVADSPLLLLMMIPLLWLFIVVDFLDFLSLPT